VPQHDNKFADEIAAVFAELIDDYFSPQINLPVAIPKLEDEENFIADKALDRKIVADYLSRPCPCNQSCHDQVTIDEVVDSRAIFGMLTKDMQNCLMLGLLKSFTKASSRSNSGRSTSMRERQKYEYRISTDRLVCRDMFLFYYGEPSLFMKLMTLRLDSMLDENIN